MMEIMDTALQPTADLGWILDEIGYDPVRESSRESRFAISNGFLGVRGGRAINRGRCTTVPPRTFVAGLFDIPGTDQPIPQLVSGADWLLISLASPDGPLIHGLDVQTTDRRTIDFRRGLLLNDSRRQADGQGLRVRMLRLVSSSDRAIGLQLIEAAFTTGELRITLEASFDGMNNGLVLERTEHDVAVWQTRSSAKRLAMASRASLWIDGNELAPTLIRDLTWSWTWRSRPGQIMRFARHVAVVRTQADVDPCPIARERLAASRPIDWRGVLAAHTLAWSDRWRCSDVEVDGDHPAQKALRFALYHLNSAADPTNDHVSIGARALTGGDYHGHVFWDTEIFLLPFYTLTWPAAARALLTYRFHTLDCARTKAARLGWRGALYAWVAADTGAETTPEAAIGPDRQVLKILCGTQEQHISADIAYAIWQYWLATHDEAFMLEAGAEILLETGRFWASRAHREADGRFHIRGVIGPDEYHEHIDDNAYTNVMARWNIHRALDVVSLLRSKWPETWAQLSSRLAVTEHERGDWSTVANSLVTGFDVKSGIYEQFAGYFDLEHVDLTDYAGRSVPIDVVLGRDRTAKSQVIKQADVVALLALLPAEFAGSSGADNFHFYEPLCSHGSSLSPAMHGIVAARLGEPDLAPRYFAQTASIDLADNHVAIDGGVHIAALGGIWLMTIFGFAGLSLREDGLALNPKLPTAWRSLAFPIQWRERNLKISIGRASQTIEATLEQGEPLTIEVNGVPHTLSRDQPLRISTA